MRSGENVNMVVQLEREDDADEPGPVVAPFFPKVRCRLDPDRPLRKVLPRYQNTAQGKHMVRPYLVEY